MTPWIVILRKAAKDRSYIISKHAHQRMGERDIAEQDVARCAARGEVLEIQDHGRDVKVLVRGVDSEGREFYVVAALRFPDPPVIVTVARFREEAWNDLGPFKKRRR
ncbi:MAG: DUF4258 domain-containing protein [Clostridia bacterium]|nr:MAG: DUF4258 domain-containing protein [Clostridia bacterium]